MAKDRNKLKTAILRKKKEASSGNDILSAIVQVGVIAACVDGHVDDQEIASVVSFCDEVLEIPASAKPVVQSAVADAIKTISAGNLKKLLDSVVKRLPDARTRWLAFALAGGVILSDEKFTNEEEEFIDLVIEKLAIPKAEVDEFYKMLS